jgi:AraC-like DNA-binding protein
MGMPPTQYLNGYRVEKAQTLLKNTDRSITDIALAVGFDDASYFARIFKKQTGMTPREYKNQSTK